MGSRPARTRRLVAASGFVALVAVAGPAGAQQWATASGQVTRAIDGESIEVKLADRLQIVRYAGISTPEFHHPTRGIDFYRRAAMAANAKIVADKRVLLTFDAEPRDRHGRLLAYVYVGNVFVNAELAGAGYAEVVTMPPNVQHRDVLMARQREARQANRGLWGDAEALLYHWPRPLGVFGNTRLQVYFHPDDSARMILLADPFLHFESPPHAAAAGYRPSMDYATFARREQKILSGEPLSEASAASRDPTTPSISAATMPPSTRVSRRCSSSSRRQRRMSSRGRRPGTTRPATSEAASPTAHTSTQRVSPPVNVSTLRRTDIRSAILHLDPRRQVQSLTTPIRSLATTHSLEEDP